VRWHSDRAKPECLLGGDARRGVRRRGYYPRTIFALNRARGDTPIASVQIAAIFRPCCVWSTPPDVDPQTRVGFSPIRRMERRRLRRARGQIGIDVDEAATEEEGWALAAAALASAQDLDYHCP